MTDIDSLIAQFLPEAQALRRQLHQIPELKYQEVKTAKLIRRTLRSYGYRPQKVGKTGVIALLDSGQPGPTVALRADMDGLPIEEKTDVSYFSRHAGVMHACGHDGHMATLLLVARVLKGMNLRGRVKLIFQPAEEGGKGSTAMIEGGVLEDPLVEAIFGYHNWPGLPLGRVGVRKGAILAGSGRLEVVVPKRIAHLAHGSSSDPVVLIGQAITELTSLASRLDRACSTLSLVTVNGEMGGEAKLVGVYHYADDEALGELQQRVRELLPSVAIPDFLPFHPPTVNSPQEADRVFEAADNPQWLDHCMMAAEDFSQYLERIPGCFFLVGSGEGAAPVHTSKFDFEDRILPIAAILMCRLLKK